MSVIPENNTPGPPFAEGFEGVILAGGRSRRYGANKALVRIDGISLIERAVKALGSVFQRLILVTNTPEEYAFLGLPMFEDLIKGLGPIGGVYTGLERISQEAGFFVACDMPFINPHLVRYMVDARGDFDGVVPRMGHLIEPLHALYTKKCLPAIRGLIDSQEHRIDQFLDRTRIRYVEEDEIRAVDPELRSFLNVNKPEDLREAALLTTVCG